MVCLASVLMEQKLNCTPKGRVSEKLVQSAGDYTMNNNEQVPIVMEEVTDPEALAKARAQRQRFDRNSAWLQAHVAEIYTRYRGKCICIAGEEGFVADTPEEALTLATTAHPEDDGRFLRYIPRHKVDRIYAH